MANKLYITCDTCGVTKYFTKFQTRGNQKSKKRPIEKVRRPYCKECKRKGWHTRIDREQQTNLNISQDVTGDKSIEQLSDEKYGYIIYKGRTGKWYCKIDLETSKKLVEREKARIRNPYTIVKLDYTNQEIRAIILERDNYTCSVCGEKADIAVKIDEDGRRTPDNMRAICYSCNNMRFYNPYKKWERRPVHYATPIYLNDKIITAIHNPPDSILGNLWDESVKVYCDASEYKGQGLYGISAVFVGGNHNGIQVYNSIFEYTESQIHYAELQAVEFALMIINDKKDKGAIFSIHTDVDFYNFIKPQEHMRQAVENINMKKGNIEIKYIDNEEQKNPFYRMAHRYCRQAIFEHLRYR